MSNIEVKWQASDGYVSGRRPQTTMVDASDFVGLDRIEAEKLFDKIMMDDFLQKVTCDLDDYDASLQEIMDAAAKLSAD